MTKTKCSVCGQEYECCYTCRSIKTMRPWRTIADTVDCYKIYMIIHDYTNGAVTKDKARKMLESCTLPDTFQEHVKTVMDEIMNSNKRTRPKAKKRNGEVTS